MIGGGLAQWLASPTTDQGAPVSRPGAKVMKLFSCSTQLNMKFKMLINIEIAKIDGIFRFNSLEPAIYPANKC